MSFTIAIADLDDLPAHLSDLVAEWAEIVKLGDAGEVIINDQTREVETVRFILRDGTGNARRDPLGNIALGDPNEVKGVDEDGVVIPFPPAAYEFLTELRDDD